MSQPGSSPAAFIGLGSNLGDREQNLATARGLIQSNAGRVVQASPIYESEPSGYADQPWFLNQVIQIEEEHPAGPRPLLEKLLAIEREMGRERKRKYGPRNIDLDLLLYGDVVEGWIKSEQVADDRRSLIVPHPRLHQRRFVLVALNDIARRLVHPVLAREVQELLSSTTDRLEVRPFVR